MNKSCIMLAAVVMLFAGFCTGYAEEEEIILGDHAKGPLGVLVTDASKEQLANLGLKGGAEIEEVFENSEAAKKGLKEKDIITALDDETIDSPEDLVEAICEMEEEKDVALTYYRDGKKNNVTVHIKPVKGKFLFHFDDEDFTMCLPHGFPGIGSCIIQHRGDGIGKGGYLGVEAKNLSEQMREYFEVDRGVLVENVVKESPAEKAGLKAGDVILSINKREIADFGDLIRTLNYYNPDEKISVEISRKGSKKNIDIVLGEKKQMPVYKRIEKMFPGGEMKMKVGPNVPGDNKIEKRIKIKTGGGDKEGIRIRYLLT
jgi:C-terminal processing protease CtpA/Prc